MRPLNASRHSNSATAALQISRRAAQTSNSTGSNVVGTATQLCFLALAAVLGFRQESVWWLVPLTVCLGVIGWLTDRYWKIRFYDIYSPRDWLKFWLETLLGLIFFVFAAYVTGQILRRLGQFYGLVP